MEINGKIIEILPEKSGQSAKGTWRKQEYVLETEGQYPKKVCFMAWGDKIDEFGIEEGESLVVSIDLESREFNGRWYTDVRAWKVARANGRSVETTSDVRDEPGSIHSSRDQSIDDVIPC